jgi:hypothetical protein
MTSARVFKAFNFLISLFRVCNDDVSVVPGYAVDRSRSGQETNIAHSNIRETEAHFISRWQL